MSERIDEEVARDIVPNVFDAKCRRDFKIILTSFEMTGGRRDKELTRARSRSILEILVVIDTRVAPFFEMKYVHASTRARDYGT